MVDKALLIGISYRGTQAELRGCINDQEKMYAYLRRVAPNCVVRVLTDDRRIRTPIFATATRYNILKQMEWLAQGATPQSRVLLAYSGHGNWRPNNAGAQEEVDRRDETIVPSDYALNGEIVDDEIRAILINALPTGAVLVALFDSCHSGTVMDLRYNWLDRNARSAKPQITKSVHPNLADTVARVLMLSGCLDSQTAADAYIAGEYCGATTRAFLYVVNVARPMAQASKVGDARIDTLEELLHAMNRWMVNNRFEQRPQASLGRNENPNLADYFALK